ncbi:DNA mismatch repair protein MutS [Candidatus Avelusimicrobium sp.]|uniref:DNA mismatch repair protein MutS n=1 Tax=Candidatus Avelusimicrobium sp. TaxID=3048833 RepID=UPI003D7DD5B7
MQQTGLTPLMKQYFDTRAKYPDIVLFFRLGDFYEMFDDQAREISALLGLTLTARNGMPMCGIPYHAANNYIVRLLNAGKKIGICEQTSAVMDKNTKLFERKVIRVITPGTLMEDTLLDANQSNYLVSVITSPAGWAMACVEVSTGEFWVNQNDKDASLTNLAAALAAVNPSEIIADKDTLLQLKTKIVLPSNLTLTEQPAFDGDYTLPENWPALGAWGNKRNALACALLIMRYLNVTEPSFKRVLIPSYRELKDCLQIDENAVASLELVKSQEGGRKGSLWALLDKTKTAVGSRKLKEWILHPLMDPADIGERQNAVEGFVNNQSALADLSALLENISDIERIMTRTATGTASPRDMSGLRNSLLNVDPIARWFEEYGQMVPRLDASLKEHLPVLRDMARVLYDAISENPPLKISDGHVIRQGYNAELDELRSLKANSNKCMEEICAREREKTGITTLKVGYTSVFGYYFEVTKSHISKVPYNYVRKQTLVNAERFITEELKQLEDKILNAEQKIIRLESSLFDEVRKTLAAQINHLKAFAQIVSELDVYMSLALDAMKGNWTKPEVNNGTELYYENGRHPLVEDTLPAGSFVPNNLDIGTPQTQIMLITGPNMGGKSVFLKQTAIITILAQMGSFVPATVARLGVVDKIMTRIGAHDALGRGNSTFMVEMNETAHILASMTPRSLILLDEVGRGTSTFDGISIAWAIVEYLYKPHGGPKVLFATHYFELVDLENKYASVRNYHVEAKEYQDASGESKLAFLYQILPGAADRSYGIHVAEIAGLPAACTLRAKKVLKDLEAKKGSKISAKEHDMVKDLFSSPIVEEIKLADTDQLTPMAALQLICEWKKRINE